MTDHDDLERRLPHLLARRAPEPPPELLDVLLRQTAVLPQQRRGLTFVGLATWAVGAAAAVLVIAAVVIRTGLPAPAGPPGAPATPSPTIGQEMITITVPGPVQERAVVEQAERIMGERLRSLGVETFSIAAGEDLTFSMLIPPDVDPVDVETVLTTPGRMEFLAWTDEPWPSIGQPVPDDVEPLFDVSEQLISATVVPRSEGQPHGVHLRFGPAASDALSRYTSEHIGEAALPVAMDGRIQISPWIQAPLTGGEMVITLGDDENPMSPEALVAILTSGPLPPAWSQDPAD